MNASDESLQPIIAAIAALDADYHARTPVSRGLHEQARRSLPGGNTRSVLHYDPYPLYISRGAGAELFDVEGHRLLDFVGEFSAGLFGHSDPVILAALQKALKRGLVLASPTELEARLAQLMVDRFPAVDRVRFCNSGTEANLLAVATARAITRRDTLLAFRHAYHGGVLSFGEEANEMNVPFDVRLATFNDEEDVARVAATIGGRLAAVIVEPLLGAGGNIAGSASFLRGLRTLCDRSGALLIFDEVKTSRLGAGGLQRQLGIRPDLTTFGKYLGGGLPLGAFGGRADLMNRFDPARADALKHAGTFNNNVCSLSAGCVALGEVYTPSRADAFTANSEQTRQRINRRFAAAGIRAQASGMGSIFSIHFTDQPLRSPADVPARSRALGRLLHRYLLLKDVLVCSRGDVFLSLPMTADQFQTLEEALLAFAAEYRVLLQ